MRIPSVDVVSLRILAAAGLLLACALLSPAPAHGLSAMAMKSLCGDVAKGSGKADEAAKARAAGDAAFEARKDEAKAREAVRQYEASLAADANQPELRVKLSRAYYLLGDGYHRLAGNDDAMLEALEKGMAHAGIALGQVNPAFKRKICTGAPLAEAVAALDRASVGPVYWWATHMGKYGLAKDLLEVLANKDMIFEAMTTLKRLQPGYFYFAPDRYLGSYFTRVPFPKGDPALAFQHLRASMSGAPDYLATYVLSAEMYAVKAAQTIDPRSTQCRPGAPRLPDDAPQPQFHPCRALYEKLLRFVLDARPEVLPDIEAEQRLEQQKAKTLLEDIDTYFPPLGQ